jgi:fatty acyl-CoA reductase
MSSLDSQVAEFYRGRSVFVTGASGFMGKVLLEKLLYSCPDLRTIYILVRSKRSKTPEQRAEEMFKIPLFDRLRTEKPDALQKVMLIQGDILLEEMGLTVENKARLQEEVSVVFHCAATLRLEAKLKDSVEMNMRGTLRVLQLARGMTQLKVLLHLSTAFCHPGLESVEERVYDSPVDPYDVLRCVQWMDEASLDMITERLIAPHPNTYTFTKQLAECLVSSHCPDIPVVIARPSIVVPSWNEPMPGWVDSLNGPIGIMVGGGKGVIRSMYCKGDYLAQVIPVDSAINGLIAIAWWKGTSSKRSNDVPVFNITAPNVRRITWKDVLNMGRKAVHENPFEMTIWYPDGNIRSNKMVHNLCVIFFHFLPAYFIDFLLLIFGQKRFMVRLQHKILAGLTVLQYFTTREWKFQCSNFLALRTQLNPTDKKIFAMNCEDMDDVDFIQKAVLGARQYCLKEPLSSLPRCRRNIKILYVVDRMMSAFFYLFLIWLVFCYSETARHVLDLSTDIFKNVPMVRNLVPVSNM